MIMYDDIGMVSANSDTQMYIPRDWNDQPNPVPSGLLFSHDHAFQRLEKALSGSCEAPDEIRQQGFDCLTGSDCHGRQYFQMMMSL